MKRTLRPHTLISTLSLLGLCTLATLPVQAGIAELLLKKGAITLEEYNQLKEEAAATSSPVQTETTLNKGFAAESPDKAYSAKVGTLMQFDVASYPNESEGIDNNSGTEMRRGRLSLQGTLMEDWQYKTEMEFFATSGTEITDMYVNYSGFKAFGAAPMDITLGHFKIPFSLEQLMSDPTLPLMERSLPNAFLNSRAPGAMVSVKGSNWSLATMAFGEQLYNKTSDDEGHGLSARLTWAPLLNDRNTVHLGIASQYWQPSQNTLGGTQSYSSRPESHITSLKLINTGTLSDVDDVVLTGAELAASLGSMLLSSEYIHSSLDRNGIDRDGIAQDDIERAEFDGWYVQASWALTGEQRSYDTGKGIFKGLTPASRSDAWELAARYSELDLNDGNISGGREHNASLGLSWYANSYVRISGNWVRVLSIDGGPYDGEDMDALQMRFQFSY